MADVSYAQFIVEQLYAIEDMRFRQMFGGFGLYSGEIFFGLIANEHVFFKTNSATRKKYMEFGSDCFRPSKKQVLKNYYEVPVDIIEDPKKLEEWAQEAIIVALSDK